MPTIQFTDQTGEVPERYNPTPAKVHIPEWLRLLQPYDGGQFNLSENGEPNNTAKRCLPMLDAIMTGYTIVSSFDVNVTQRDGGAYYQWQGGLGIAMHPNHQAKTHSAITSGHSIAKFLNPWAVETPPGYSTLFVPPLNQDSPVISTFAGLVDTDRFVAPVHFPFITPPGFRGIIEAGTPLAQVIPIKRERWQMEIVSGTNQQIERTISSVVRKFRNAYRHNYWLRKEYN
jgi:hypothetical protein